MSSIINKALTPTVEGLLIKTTFWPRDKVIKLWNGFRRSIQAALWNEKLNPEISSWRKILAAAEIIEIAESVNGNSKESKADSYSGSVLPSNRGKRHHEKSYKKSRDTSGTSRRGTSNNASGSRPTPPSVQREFHLRPPPKDNRSQQFRGRGGHSRFNSTPRREFVKKEPVDYGLPDKEKATRLADGRCFGCNETGHLARNCPKRSSVKHTGNKPPGISTFNMELIEENLPSDSNSAEVLDSLPLGWAKRRPWFHPPLPLLHLRSPLRRAPPPRSSHLSHP